MRRVGTVERVAGGLAIARGADESHPEVGTEVVDEHLEAVGEVVAVFGPVDRPYVAISPDRRTPASLLDEPLYAR